MKWYNFIEKQPRIGKAFLYIDHKGYLFFGWKDQDLLEDDEPTWHLNHKVYYDSELPNIIFYWSYVNFNDLINKNIKYYFDEILRTYNDRLERTEEDSDPVV